MTRFEEAQQCLEDKAKDLAEMGKQYQLLNTSVSKVKHNTQFT